MKGRILISHSLIYLWTIPPLYVVSHKTLIAKSVCFLYIFFSPVFPSFNHYFVSSVLLHVVRAQEPGRAHFTSWLLKNCRIGLCNMNLSVFNGTSPRYSFLPYLAWLDHSYTYWCIFCTIIFLLFSMVYYKFLCFLFLFSSYTPAILATHAKNWTKIIAGLDVATWPYGCKYFQNKTI